MSACGWLQQQHSVPPMCLGTCPGEYAACSAATTGTMQWTKLEISFREHWAESIGVQVLDDLLLHTVGIAVLTGCCAVQVRQCCCHCCCCFAIKKRLFNVSAHLRQSELA